METNTANRYLAYFDIMGFKDRYYRQGHQHVSDMMNNFSAIIEDIRGISRKQRALSEEPEGLNPSLVIESVIFSDTVILYSKDTSKEALRSIMYTAARFMADCLHREIPIKGVIAKGEFTADQEKSLYFGMPLIDAHMLSEEIKFYGAVFHHTVQLDLLEVRPVKALELATSHITY